jgi:hypothetical protein
MMYGAKDVCSLPLRAFVDPGYMHWLKDAVPPRLLADLQREYGPHLEGIPWDAPVDELFGRGLANFYPTLTKAFEATHDPDLPFHGMKHSQRVTCLGEDGLGRIAYRVGRLPNGLSNLALLGLALHDLRHCGAAFFALAKPGRVPPDANIDMPLEVYSALKADEFLLEHGYRNALGRMVVNYIIISSAFGAMNPEHGKRLQLDRVQPRAIFGTLMRVCDVLPVSDFVDTITAEADLMYVEVPAMPAPPNRRDYLESRERFLSYVTAMMQLLDSALQQWLDPHGPIYDVTSELGWVEIISDASQNLARAQQRGVRGCVLDSTLHVRKVTLN